MCTKWKHTAGSSSRHLNCKIVACALQVAIMKKLRAENIVRFLGVCMKDSKTMLVTEFMAGGDLFTRLSEAEIGGELSWYHM